MPEQPHSSQVRQRLERCFQRGTQRAAAHDADYAHAMFAECVTGDPGNLEYVEALLANLQARHGEQRKRPGGRVGRPLRAAIEAQQWDEALRLGIEALGSNPWHVATLQALARVCEARHFNEVELAYLKAALDANPRDPEVNRHCARSLARMGQFDQAIACWHRVEKYVPRDPEAAAMIARLAEEKLRWGGGAPAAEGESRGAAAGGAPEEASEPSVVEGVGVGAASASVTWTPRQALENAIAEDPADVTHYLQLAELLASEGEFEQAERWLDRAERHCAQRSAIEQARDEVRTQRAEAVAAAAQRQRKAGEQQANARRVPWLEMLLATALGGLVLQVVPGWQAATWEFVQQNLRVLLIVLNVVVLLVLVWWNQRKVEG